MNSSEQQRQEAATHWYVRLQNPQLPASERIDFRRWLDSDPANAEAFHAVELLWKKLAAPAQRLASTGWHRRKPTPQWLRGPMLSAACILGLAVATLFWRDPGVMQRYTADHASAPGSQQQLTLADGSQVLLDADSAMDLHFSAGERRVTLLRGRAWFDVQHDAGRPFVVESRKLTTRVLGTAFAVDASGASEQVTVSRGRVEVRTASGAHLQLTPDQQASLDADGLQGPRTVDGERALAWRRGLLIFDRASLGEVLDSLQRMDHPPVVLLDRQLRERRLSGTFPSNNPQALLAAISAELGLKSTRLPGLAVVLHR
ncbi:FecR family protein [Pseudomonas sp. Gutcm_11s]|uniref:FecR family protein n=1 Tax=Pseudomonas sp. Gutcm_11s TaxID=3026088 RepID=UPI002362D241|nr:FecR family protein [Pseudomonas sp. Gutcm_11s]MDD0841749.1 FecR family protein [Pseudomonas sp. Gutcm_11s]